MIIYNYIFNLYLFVLGFSSNRAFGSKALRLRSMAAGIRTPNLSLAGQRLKIPLRHRRATFHLLYHNIIKLRHNMRGYNLVLNLIIHKIIIIFTFSNKTTTNNKQSIHENNEYLKPLFKLLQKVDLTS